MMGQSWESGSVFRFIPWAKREKESIWRRILDRLSGAEKRHLRAEQRKLEQVREHLVRFEAGEIWIETLYAWIRSAVWPNAAVTIAPLNAIDAKQKEIAKLKKTVARLRRRCEELIHPMMQCREFVVSAIDPKTRELVLQDAAEVRVEVVPDPVKERVGAKISALKKELRELRWENADLRERLGQVKP